MLEQIRRGKQARPRRTVLYGVHGIGKSTWCSKWPSPVFVPTEDGIGDLDVASFPLATTLEDAWQPVLWLGGEEAHDFKTVVIDSADWLEMLIYDAIEKKHGKPVQKMGYQEGYIDAADRFRRFLNALECCRQRGMHCVFTAHAAMEKFENPEGESYHRFAPKLHKRISSVLQEWADEVLFATYETFVATKDEGFNKSRGVAVGDGKRLLKTTERPAHNAKNRLGLPEELPFEFSAYAPFLGLGVSDNG
jgi:hypothetical protein